MFYFTQVLKTLPLSIWGSEGLQSVYLRPIHTTKRCLCNVSPNKFKSASNHYLSTTMLLFTFSHKNGLMEVAYF